MRATSWKTRALRRRGSTRGRGVWFSVRSRRLSAAGAGPAAARLPRWGRGGGGAGGGWVWGRGGGGGGVGGGGCSAGGAVGGRGAWGGGTCAARGGAG